MQEEEKDEVVVGLDFGIESDWKLLATLRNPVDKGLYNVWYDSTDEVIVTPPWEFPELLVATGSVDDEDKEIGGQVWRRAHTPTLRKVRVDTLRTARETLKKADALAGRSPRLERKDYVENGVTEQGRGLGLMLYCGLALTAYQKGAQGVYSERGDRSESADAFWRSQVERGFAEDWGGDVQERDVWVSPSMTEVMEALVADDGWAYHLEPEWLSHGERIAVDVEVGVDLEEVDYNLRQKVDDVAEVIGTFPSELTVEATLVLSDPEDCACFGDRTIEWTDQAKWSLESYTDKEEEVTVRYITTTGKYQTLDAEKAAKFLVLWRGEKRVTRKNRHGMNPSADQLASWDLRLVEDPVILDLIGDTLSVEGVTKETRRRVLTQLSDRARDYVRDYYPDLSPAAVGMLANRRRQPRW